VCRGDEAFAPEPPRPRPRRQAHALDTPTAAPDLHHADMILGKDTSCSSAFLDVLEGFKSALSRATVVDNRRRVSPAETNSHVREIYRLGFPFMLLWDHLEQMHGVGREQADRCERKTSKAEATCEPSERHHAGDNRPRSENDANLKCC
jgi:hypothetical protein